MSEPLWIAIDGPSGTGKSSAARGLASALDWSYLDTGAMYRAATVIVLEQVGAGPQRGAGPSLTDVDPQAPYGSAASRAAAQAVEQVVAQAHISSGLDPSGPTIAIGDRSLTREIRDVETTRWVSVVASIPGVRKQLVSAQREIALAHSDTGIVVEGRDISAVVLPEAPLRIYLTASAAVRARRRANDPAVSAPAITGHALEATQRDLERRDAIDQSRAEDPAGVPAGAIVVDSSEMNLNQVIETLISLYRDIDISAREGGHGSSGETA